MRIDCVEAYSKVSISPPAQLRILAEPITPWRLHASHITRILSIKSIHGTVTSINTSHGQKRAKVAKTQTQRSQRVYDDTETDTHMDMHRNRHRLSYRLTDWNTLTRTLTDPRNKQVCFCVYYFNIPAIIEFRNCHSLTNQITKMRQTFA